MIPRCSITPSRGAERKSRIIIAGNYIGGVLFFFSCPLSSSSLLRSPGCQVPRQQGGSRLEVSVSSMGVDNKLYVYTRSAHVLALQSFSHAHTHTHRHTHTHTLKLAVKKSLTASQGFLNFLAKEGEREKNSVQGRTETQPCESWCMLNQQRGMAQGCALRLPLVRPRLRLA